MDTIAPSITVLHQVYTAIMEAICEGRLTQGERLTQESVAGKLNVSRQPVGQALLILKNQSFVRETGRRGLVVAPIDPAFIRCIYEVRLGVDPVAAGLAATRAPQDAIEPGRRILRTGEKALASGSVIALGKAEMDFHMLIYRLSENHLLLESMETYWNHLRRAMREVLKRKNYRASVWMEHADILAAVEAGDTKRAERVARRHIVASADFLEQQVSDAVSK
jgi:DNA-binding GntR family transcriptional regulator